MSWLNKLLLLESAPLNVVVHVGVKPCEVRAGQPAQQLRELGLPHVAVLHDGQLQRGEVQHHKLHLEQRLLVFCVLGVLQVSAIGPKQMTSVQSQSAFGAFGAAAVTAYL